MSCCIQSRLLEGYQSDWQDFAGKSTLRVQPTGGASTAQAAGVTRPWDHRCERHHIPWQGQTWEELLPAHSSSAHWHRTWLPLTAITELLSLSQICRQEVTELLL